MSTPLVEQIEASLSLSVCTGWDRDFLESILQQINRGRKLSAKQNTMIGKVLDRNTPEQQMVHEGWKDVYHTQYAEKAFILAKYYERQTYYKEMARTILANEVPERTRFMRMLENKYAQKVLSEYEMAPKYELGSLVTGRANFDQYAVDYGTPKGQRELPWPHRKICVENFLRRGALIIEVDNKIFSAAKGAKRYKVLPIGSPTPFFVEERFIKIKRK
tara:strand:- start:349 stop:1002 length:654 start_codon:yes stop_codon:yes gene_type:complete